MKESTCLEMQTSCVPKSKSEMISEHIAWCLPQYKKVKRKRKKVVLNFNLETPKSLLYFLLIVLSMHFNILSPVDYIYNLYVYFLLNITKYFSIIKMLKSCLCNILVG